MMDRKTIKEICEKIAYDARNDAINFDGQPFTGKTMGTYLGYHGAAIVALANIVNSLVDELETIQPTVN